jgi:predicted transcriptional regulator
MPTKLGGKLGAGKPGAGRQLSIWLPKRIDAEVQRIAEAECITASAVVRRAVVRDVARHTKAVS